MLIAPIVLLPLMIGRRGNRYGLHVGAHKGEELSLYERAKFRRVDWVEGQPDLCDALRATLPPERHKVYQAYVWSASGVEKRFRVTNNSQSSSLLPLGTHADYYPRVKVTQEISVKTSRLDDLIKNARYTFINLDIQGAELEALKGMGDLISATQIVYTEVNREPLYEGCALVGDLDGWLGGLGFSRVVTKWTSKGWGDAIYVRKVSAAKIWLSRQLFRSIEYRQTTRGGVRRSRPA